MGLKTLQAYRKAVLKVYPDARIESEPMFPEIPEVSGEEFVVCTRAKQPRGVISVGNSEHFAWARAAHRLGVK